MAQILNALQNLILGLFRVITEAMGAIESFLRHLMTQAGISVQVQEIVLIVVLVLLILAAVRLFGRVFGVLIAVFLVLLMIHVLMHGLAAPGGLHG